VDQEWTVKDGETPGRFADGERGPAEYPLSAAQQTRWMQYLLAPSSAAYNVNFTVGLGPATDLEALRQGLYSLIRRQSVLRTVYAERPLGSVQLVRPGVPDVLKIFDLQSDSPDELQRLLRAEADRPFDLEQGPVLRVNAIRRHGAPVRLQVVVHHIAMDFSSVGIFLDELSKFHDHFAAGVPLGLAPPAGDYGDYAENQREYLGSEAGRQGVAYWAGKLRGELPVLALPVDRPYPDLPSFSGTMVVRSLDERQTALLRRAGRDNRATPYLAMLTGFALWLRKLCGQNELIIGTPVGDRPDEAAELMIGDFVNTLPLKLDLDGLNDFASAAFHVREEFLEAIEHSRVPLAAMLGESRVDRSQGASPVFQALFVWNRFGPALADLEPSPSGGLALDTLDGSSTGANGSTHELSLMVVDRGVTLDLRWTFSASIFEPSTMERLADGFSSYLERLIGGNASDPAEGRLGPDPAWNDTKAAFPEDSGMHQLIEAQVHRTPDRVALACPGQGSLTYFEMNQRANRLAHHLIALGVGPDKLVGLVVERSLEMPIAILATMKAGGAYLPIDTAMNETRLKTIVDDARPVVILTQKRFMDMVESAGIPTLALDEPESERLLELCPSHDPPPGTFRSTDLAYVMYTSGSTGVPKGVMIEHRALVNRIWWMHKRYPLGADDVVVQKTPYAFDVSGWEFFCPLIAGATLAVAKPQGHRDPAYLAEFIRAEGVSVLHFVPSMLGAMLEEETLGQCRSIRRVFTSGEALGVDLEQKFFEILPGAELHNLYGPTEAAIEVSYWACRPGHGEATVPIGRPIDNIRLYILDSAGEHVAVGEAGELHIGGVALARGYLNKPEITAEKFVCIPGIDGGGRLYKTGDLTRYRPDGAIEFIGRTDRQVKIRGLRLELGEVELALKSFDGVGQAFVDTVVGQAGQRRLVAFFVAKPGAGANVDRIRAHLANRLPEHAIPSVLTEVDSFPVTANGKLDRSALLGNLQRETPLRPFAPPRTDSERALCAIVGDVLGVERVGLDDPFFELGGDSISSLRVLARARAAGLDFELEALVVLQTVRKLAEVARRRDAPAVADEVRPVPALAAAGQELAEGVEGVFPLSALQAGMVYHNILERRANAYHEVSRYRVRGRFDEEALGSALAGLCREHEVLRTSFLLDATPEPLQCVWKEAGIPLRVIDLRDEDPKAQREALEAWMEAERLTGFDWTRAPLLRCFVHRLDDDEFMLSLSFSHAILDGWSAAVLLVKLLERAQRPDERPIAVEPDSGFRQFIALERQAAASPDSASFWRREVEAAPPAVLVEPPGGDGNSKPVGNSATTLDPDILTRALALARTSAVSLRTVLLAAHLKVLALLRGEGEVVSGLVVNGRPEVENAGTMLGLFLNTIPFRIDADGVALSELVRTVAAKEAAISPHRRFPLQKIQEGGGGALFDVVFHFVHFHTIGRINQAAGGWSVAIEELYGETNFPLLVSFMRDTGSPVLKLQLAYNSSWFEAPFVDRLLALYARALETLLAEPGAPVPRSDLEALDPDLVRRSPLAASASAPSAEAAWRERLAGQTEVHPVPLDLPRPPRKGLDARTFTFRIRAHPALSGSRPPDSWLRALFVVLLARLGRVDDLVVGIASGLARDPEGNAAGAFAGAVPVRADVSASESIVELLETIAAKLEEAARGQAPDLGLLAHGLGHEPSDSYAPICQILIEPGRSAPDSTVAGPSYGFDLCFGCDVEGDGLACRIAYDPALFGPDTIAMMARALETLLEGAADNPRAKASELPLVRRDDAANLSRIDACAIVEPAVPSLHEAVRRQAKAFPSNVAVSWPGGALTYAELDSRSDRLARILIGRRVRTEARICLCLPRSTQMLVGMLSVLKAGAAYVPLDPASPPERLDHILSDAGADLILSEAACAASAGLDGRSNLILLDSAETELALDEAVEPDFDWPSGEGAAAAYVIYTSGSTGLPKGVVVEHRNVLRLFEASQPLFRFGAGDVWTLFHSYAFDFSVWEIFGALLHGGRLVIVPDEIVQAPKRFLELLAREGVTILNQTPSAFYNLLAAIGSDPPPLPALRSVVFGGEALDPRKLRPWFEAYGFDRIAMINMYGITETTVHVTYKRIGERELEEGLSAIGKPLADLSIHVVDEALNLVPRGAKGELCVGGGGVAREYLNRPDLTRERFIEGGAFGEERVYRSGDLARITRGGELEYLGRMDRQVKIRGFRIELGEIENQIVAVSGASNAVVRVVEGASGPDRLVAYLVEPGYRPKPAWRQDLRERLGRVLPDYMIPAFFVRLEAIPLTVNGKIDLAAFPDPIGDADERPYSRPRDPLESSLAQMFEAVTQVVPVGTDDDFYAIGGDSIRVVQLLAKLERLGHVIDGSSFLRNRTVGRLAAYLRERDPEAQMGRTPAPLHLVAAEPVARGGDSIDAYAVTDTQQLMLEQHVEVAGAYHPQHVFEIRGAGFSPPAFSAALDGRLAKHASLKSSFRRGEHGRYVQIVHSAPAAEVTVEDISALAEQEQLEALGRYLANDLARPFDLAGPPPLMRFRLFRRSDTLWNLVISSHHAIEDGWGFVEFIRSVMTSYAAALAGRALPDPGPGADVFKERVALEREAEGNSQARAFWERLLDGVKPADPGPRSPVHEAIRIVRPADRLSAAAERASVSLRSLFLLAWMKALAPFFEGEAVVVDVVTNGRSNRLSDPIGGIGLFWSLLPIRFEPEGGPRQESLLRLDGLLAQVEEQAFFPVSVLVGTGRRAGLTPAAFNYMHFHNAGPPDPGFALVEAVDRFHHPLKLAITVAGAADEIAIDLEYDSSRFPAERAAALAERLRALLEEVAVPS
jgi:amino acid adenylation domain-containing protein